MRLLRKRPAAPDIEIRLGDLLEPYFSDSVPAAEHQAIAAVRCQRCSHAIIYDARTGPGSCNWCDYELRIDLEREDRQSSRELRRARRR